MPELVARVGSRSNRETYVVMRLGAVLADALTRAHQLTSVVEGLTGFGSFDVVVGDCPLHGYEMAVVLAAGTDYEAQIGAFIAGCRERLGLTITRQTIGPGSYESHALWIQGARTQKDN